jgi:dUTP pyrophosphatase
MFRKKVKIINLNKYMLEYKSAGAACMDLHANITEAITLQPGQRALIKTGVWLELPKNYEAQIRPRSGLVMSYGVTVLNTPGTIDEDYRGEVGVILANLGNAQFTIHIGARIAQIAFKKVYKPRLKFVEKLSETIRGKGGFGSTGK